MEARPQSPSSEYELDGDYADTKRGQTPEKRLMVAVVRRAVWDFVLYRDSKNAEHMGIAAEAAGWLFSDEEDAPEGEDERYTFVNICSALELDPRYVRECVLRLKRDDIPRLNNNIKDD